MPVGTRIDWTGVSRAAAAGCLKMEARKLVATGLRSS